MIEIEKIGNGVMRYIETEITPQFPGWQRLAAETAVGLIISRLPEMAKEWETVPFVKELGLLENGKADIDAIYQEAIKHFGDKVDVKLPVVGTLHFVKDDLTALYRSIKEGT